LVSVLILQKNIHCDESCPAVFWSGINPPQSGFAEAQRDCGIHGQQEANNQH
jgi:hypothetical protein